MYLWITFNILQPNFSAAEKGHNVSENSFTAGFNEEHLTHR